ncbi:transcription initiation factor IID, TAF10 subunit [Lophiostoma macrostomum CBS 122681]|uniref:Transcription initiation factor TFIID subunit 10 n=1 Tax=Lophiostoma macrostomum CBS 122681 TaxID=1314788 RepID=A0A6A6TQ31_9PLEO|nr:transcription initiation factor IID, TAF10 subunit [Lophiostoma macrostomum CBS 122681]
MADITQPSANGLASEVANDLEASLEADVTQDPTQPDSMNLDGANDAEPSAARNGVTDAATALESRIPAKKDATLREFLGKMDDYAPIIPDAVTNYYLTLAGLPPPPQTSPHLARLLALATQKFIADIAADAYQYSRIRSSNTTSNNPMGGLGGAAGMAGPQGAAAAGGAQGSKDAQAKGLNLGVQRPGYGGGGQGGGQGRTVLTMEDLGMAVGEYGVNIKRGEFYR